MVSSVVPAWRNRETEVKIRIQDSRALRARLRQLGAVQIHTKALEDNVLFDTPDRALRKIRSILRLRSYGCEWSVTYKGTPDPDRFFKSRQEFETEIDHPEGLEAIFRALGMVPVFRYQKYRTRFSFPRQSRRGTGELEVALDETPIGDFIELEGSRRAIDRIAQALGYSRADYSTASYGALYLEDCARKNITPGDMVFAPMRRRAAGLRKRRQIRPARRED